MSKVPNTIWLFRITHIDNLDYILRYGIVPANTQNLNPDFIKIGDNTLIDFRVDLPVPKSPFGKFSEYIPLQLSKKAYYGNI
jgi:hypothetical protein